MSLGSVVIYQHLLRPETNYHLRSRMRRSLAVEKRFSGRETGLEIRSFPTLIITFTKSHVVCDLANRSLLETL